MTILLFRLKDRPTRERAINWLINNILIFPKEIGNEYEIGPDLFHGWRFIRALNGNIYFANCIEEGISSAEFYKRKTPKGVNQ